MGSITSGIGLISGFPIQDVIDQLIAVESRPKQLVVNQTTRLKSQQTAFAEVSAKLLSLKLSAGSFSTSNLFSKTKAASSNEDVLTASSTTSATPGSYSFTVDRLVTAQQTVTRGFADFSSSFVAPAGATFTLESGAAKLSSNTSLDQLNGGEGINRGRIRITDRSGASEVIDLSKALTVNDVLDAINSAETVNVAASLSADGFVLTDNTGQTAANLTVADLGLTQTATSLGLQQSVAASTLTGSDVNSLAGSTLLSILNDNNGVRTSAGNDLTITDDSGSYVVDLTGATTLDDIASAIDTASSGAITLQYAGSRLEVVGTGNVTVAAANNSRAAEDLGILGSGAGTLTGSRILSGLNTRLLTNLQGGYAGGADTLLDAGTIDVTSSAGSFSIDLSGAETVDDVLSLINSAGAGITATLNETGNGLVITDDAAGSLTIADQTGNAAAFLQVAGSFTDGVAASGNLQFRYISEATRLNALNGGRGIAAGQFRVTDSTGSSALIDLSQGNEQTIADVIAEINSRGLALTASINETGDGILLTDTGPGTIAISVEEAGSTTARDLGLLGSAANPGENLDGSFERTVTIEATDTLEDVATKINEAKVGVTATIINDGSSANPYRLSLQARDGGTAGAFLFDDGGLDLRAFNLVDAQDAVVFYGSSDPARAIAVTSTTNQLKSLVPGVTLDLQNASANPVTVTVSRDDEQIISQISSFIEAFNGVVDSLNKHDSFDQETETRGILLGDSTISRVRSSLYRLFNTPNPDVSSQFTFLPQVGIRVGSGAKIEFNEDRFRTALANDRDAVKNLLALKTTVTNEDGSLAVTEKGTMLRFDDLLNDLTNSVDGSITRRVDAIDDQIQLNDQRIEAIDRLLAAKRSRLELQFQAMERTLGELQAQSGAIAGLASLSIPQQQSSQSFG